MCKGVFPINVKPFLSRYEDARTGNAVTRCHTVTLYGNEPGFERRNFSLTLAESLFCFKSVLDHVNYVHTHFSFTLSPDISCQSVS